MKSLAALVKFELRLFTRNFINIFFVLVFPLLMLVLFGSIYGNKPSPLFNGHGMIDVSIPSYICMITAVTAFMSLPITLCTYRKDKYLKRLRATPAKPGSIVLAQFIVNFLANLVGILLLVLGGFLIYKINFLGNLLVIILVFLLMTASMFSIGALVASVFNNPKTAILVANIIYFPMIFLSGATVPIEIMPPFIQKLAQVLPMTHAVRAMKGAWTNAAINSYQISLIIMVVILFGCAVLSLKAFKWE